MIDQIEERLRDSLREHSAHAPRGHRMLPAVRLESRRRRSRRRAGLATVAATVLLGGALGASTLIAQGPAGLQAAGPTLVAGAPTGISFPFTPGKALAGVSSPALTLAAGVPTLTYTHPGSGHVATVTVRDTSPVHVSPQPVSVRGHAGTFSAQSAPSGPAIQVLSWPERPDLWVEIRTSAPETMDDLIAYALALRTEPMTRPLPFVFDLVPAGLTVDNVYPSAVTFAPPDVPASEAFNGRLVVMLDAAARRPLDGRQVRVGHRDGWLSEAGQFTLLRVDNSDGRVLTLQLDHSVGLSHTDLLRFAAGVHVGAGAQVGNG